MFPGGVNESPRTAITLETRPGGAETNEKRDGGFMYLDVLSGASVLDHSVWASPDTLLASDTYAQAIEHLAKRRRNRGSGGSGGRGGLIFGAICCVLVIVAIGVGIYLMTKRKKNNDQGGQAPYGRPDGQLPYGQAAYGQAPYGQTGDQPLYGQQPYGQPPYGAPGGQPPYGGPGGQPPYGH
ncbi:hypothetical protein IU445_04425 [Nocardia farcinica]|nr:hypothetical protein [Nocardia farcinica]